MKPNEQYFKNTHDDLLEANDISKRMTLEFMIIALHQNKGFGAKRIHEVLDEYRKVEREYSKLVVDDAKGDKKMIYAKEKIDQALRFLGDVPEFDVRYGMDKKPMIHVHPKKHHGKKKKK